MHSKKDGIYWTRYRDYASEQFRGSWLKNPKKTCDLLKLINLVKNPVFLRQVYQNAVANCRKIPWEPDGRNSKENFMNFESFDNVTTSIFTTNGAFRPFYCIDIYFI